MSIAAKLHAAINAICPIHGVSIGRVDDKSTWRVDFKDQATVEERQAAASMVDQFDLVADAIASLRAAARERINAARDAAIAAGVVYGGVLYDSDEPSQRALNGTLSVAQAGVPLPEGFTWRAADNTDHAFDAGDLVGLAAAMIAHGYAQHLKARALKAAIDAAQTAEAVAAVTWEG